MCMRKCFLSCGEKIFHVLVILGFLAGGASGIMSGMEIGGKAGIIAAIIQVVLSWSGTLIIALVVYSLLNISHCMNSCCKDGSGKCETNDCN